jgi:hypothetical protein
MDKSIKFRAQPLFLFMMNLLRKAFFATVFFLPPRHQGTKKHKEMNINSIILVNPSCLGVLVAYFIFRLIRVTQH